jgi:hypothetical protein
MFTDSQLRLWFDMSIGQENWNLVEPSMNAHTSTDLVNCIINEKVAAGE